MTNRWRGRSLAGLAAIGVGVVLTAGAALGAGRPPGRFLVVRDSAGAVLVRTELPPSGEFSLTYRNSLYHSLAGEDYRVDGDRLELVALDANELAVLEEYSNAFGAVPGRRDSDLRWTVAVDRAPIALPLRVKATSLGERTLIVDGTRIALWRLVAQGDDPLVTISVERGG